MLDSKSCGSRGLAHLDAVVFVQNAAHQLAADVDAGRLVVNDAKEDLQQLDNPAADTQARIGNPIADLGQVLDGERGVADDIFADQLD